jgi:hypothetical protein
VRFTRVSKIEQDLEHKMDMLVKYGVEGRNIYEPSLMKVLV